MRNIILLLIGLVIVCTAVCGLVWLGKTFSYWLFYGDMVEQAIREMVKQSCLR